MSKLKSLISLVIILIFFSGCQTVKDKTDAIVEKENEKLSKFLGKSASELQMELGKPDEDLKLQLRGISIDVEESRESLLAAIKLLESRLDLFRI